MFIINYIYKDDVMKANSIIKKSLLSSIFFVILVVIVFYFIFKETTFKDVILIFQKSNKTFIFFGILCMFFYNLLEGLNIKIVLNSLGNKIKLSKCYKYAVGAFFTASITPSSSGGDPMAFYLMTKDKIPVSHSAIALFTKLMVYQFVMIILASISFFTSYNQITTTLGNFKYLVFLGLFLNILVFTLYFLIVFFKQIIIFIVEIIGKVLNKFHYKKTSELQKKINLQIEEYSKSATILKTNKKIILKCIVTTLIQIVLFFSIPYFVYLALGYQDTSIFKFITTQAVLNITVSSLPFPGAVGISEAIFMKLYKNLFNPNVLGSAMFITRFINFYLFVIYTGILLAIFIIKDNLKKAKERVKSV